jgi:choline kinase
MAVNRAVCAEEEIKYRTGADGAIVEVSKQVVGGEGEAVGINLVTAADLPLFRQCLAECGDRDYFERGLELALERGLKLVPVDIGSRPCIEIDFEADLLRAREVFG